MELRQYWNVIWRRRWLVLGIISLVTILSVLLALTASKSYRGDMVFTARQEPVPLQPGSEQFIYNYYYRNLSSEFLVDDYTQMLLTQAFARDIIDTVKSEAAAGRPQSTSDIEKLRSDIGKLKYKDVLAMLGVDRRQRELHIFITTGTRDLTASMLEAAAIVITRGEIKPFRGETRDKPLFGQMDEVVVKDFQSSSSKEVTNAAIRVILSIVAALALAFLLEYLDRSVRDERDARRLLDVPVLGTIPRA